MVVTAGLGVGILKEEHQSSVLSIEHTKPATTPSERKTPKQSTPSATTKMTFAKYIKIVLKKLDLGPTDSVRVSQELLDSIPVSKICSPPIHQSIH